MLVKLALALLGGTVLSLMFGYIVAYWRDMGKDSSKSMDDQSWLKFFETLTKLKKEAFIFSGRQKKQGPQQASQKDHQKHQRRSRAPNSWQKHPEVERLLLKFEDFYPELYRYFQNLRENGDELIGLEAKELEHRLKIRVSSSMMADRMHELLELKAFDALGVQNSGAQAVRELWLCYSVGHIYLDDARFGSATLSKKLCHEMSLDEASIFRGIEAQCLLAKGASKKALFKKYWQEQQKKSFERSQYLQSLTPFEQSELCFKWTRAKSGIEEIEQQLRETLKEIEASFQEFYREQNSEDKKGQHKKQRQRQKKQERPSQASTSQTPPLQWAYDLLEMRPTSEFSSIKKQFKKMAMKYHPDRLAREGLSELECRRHHEHFVEVQKAYKALEKRYGSKAA